MPEAQPLVSVIVPCRNERAYIAGCLDSILGNDYPADRREILVVDGMSDDGTADIVAAYAAQHPAIRLLENPQRIVPCALNRGIAGANGTIIIRMDAHNTYPDNYISQLVHWLEQTGADNVGGAWVTLPANRSAVARAIARALAHPFGIGNARYRLGVDRPVEVDTVPFGCYRREVFERIGLFDEELVRNQDDEFNARLVRAGGKIVLVPGVVSHYHARATLSKLARMYFQYGWFKPYVGYKTGRLTTWRQLAPSLLILALGIGGLLAPFFSQARWAVALLAGGYLSADIAVSAGIARLEGIRSGLAALVVFPVLHFSYGLGYLYGLLRLVLYSRSPLTEGESVRLSR